jgi:cell division protein FtsI (penicillin-binding protein 3)
MFTALVERVRRLRRSRSGGPSRRQTDPVVEGALRHATRPPARALDLLDLSEGPDPEADLAWRATIKHRVGVVLVICGCWAGAVEARLVYLQLVSHDFYVAKAERQQQRVLRPGANRGDIIDRHGRTLAYSVDAEAIFADPGAIEGPIEAAAEVCRALGPDCTAAERRDLAERFSAGNAFAYIRRSLSVSPDQVARVMDLGLTGISTTVEPRRYYPNRELAAHVLGFVGQENKGLGGIESAYDAVIRGREGLVLVQTDGGQQFISTRVERAPTAGATLELSLDLNLQYIAERELEAGVLENHAQGGTVVIMEPFSGEILALANYPTFNPNDYRRAAADARKNRAVQDVYEPGSTFKIVTASAAIEEGVVRPSDIIDTSPGWIKLPGRPAIDDVGSYSGPMTFEEVIIRSSNVGAIKVGLRTGADRINRYVRRFGFGQSLTADLPGQSAGVVTPPADLDESGLASVSMGYQISVTPVQMAAAASAVANGGRLMEAHIVRAVIRDGVREPVEPRELRRAIEPETARILTAMMEGVVSDPRGTGGRARLGRYRVAGKSGTAKKVIDRRYSDTDYNVSFVGFVPSRRPALTILVVIDTPRAASNYGGSVSAPIFKRVAEAALQQLGVPPSINPAPHVVATAGRDAAESVERARAAVVVPASAPVAGPGLMPDVRGLGAREAVRVLTGFGLQVRVQGAGVVVAQRPEAGSPIESGDWARLHLDRRPAESAAAGGGR